MGQTESETIQETTMENMSGVIYKLLRQVTELELRLNKVERAYDALGRRLEGSERHVEDEGWFD
jgi:predicted RNase H-like nuclease (RuvC/YqgF family)